MVFFAENFRWNLHFSVRLVGDILAAGDAECSFLRQHGLAAQTEFCRWRRFCFEFFTAAHAETIAVTNATRTTRTMIVGIFLVLVDRHTATLAALSAKIGVGSIFSAAMRALIRHKRFQETKAHPLSSYPLRFFNKLV